LVTTVCAPIIEGPVIVTVTPGRTAPVLSWTRPWMLPVELAPPLCAGAVPAAAAKTSARRGTIRLCILDGPPQPSSVGLRPAGGARTRAPGVLSRQRQGLKLLSGYTALPVL